MHDRIKQYATREDWLASRRAFIGASESAAILGESNWATPFTVWSQKLGLIDDMPSTIRMRRGLALENLIAELYAEETGRQVSDPGTHTVFYSKERYFIGATLDRWTRLNPDWQTSPLELKTANASQRDEWREGVPRQYWIQVQHQMYVVDAPKASIAALVGDDFLWMDVERDSAFIDEILVPALVDFWKLVQDEEPPCVDASEETRKALQRLYSTPIPETIILPPEFQELDQRRIEIDAQAKLLTAERDEIDNRIRLALGNNECGELPDCRYTWKLQQRKEYTVPASETRVLRRIAKKGEDE